MTKLAILLPLLVAFGFGLKAQTIVENDPKTAFTQFVAPEFGFELASTEDNLAIGITLGATARRQIVSNLTGEAALRIGITGMLYQAEGGIYFSLFSKEKSKPIRVVTEAKAFAGTDDQGRTYDEVSYIEFDNGKFHNTYGLHGGIYSKTMKLSVGDDISAPEIKTNAHYTGVYLGLQMTTQAFMKVDIPNLGERIGAGFTRIFLDVMYFPVNSIGDNLEKDDSFGGRIGMHWYVNPHDGDFKGLLGKSVITAEIGTRPYDKYFLGMSWAIALLAK